MYSTNSKSSRDPKLASLARTKMLLSVSSSAFAAGRDALSLHRWVLLKNSIGKPSSQSSMINFARHAPEVDEDGDEDEDTSNFVFPSLSHDAPATVHEHGIVLVEEEKEQQRRLVEPTPTSSHSSTLAGPSAHMFEHAQNVLVTGGTFNATAGDTVVDNSVSMSVDASVRVHPVHLATSMTHVCQVHLSASVPELSGGVGAGEESGEELVGSSSVRGERVEECLSTSAILRGDGEGAVLEDLEEANEDSRRNCRLVSPSPPQIDLLHPLIENLCELDEVESENYQHEPGLTLADSAHIPCIDDRGSLIDEVIHGILSTYPPPPEGDPQLLSGIVKALLFSFSPLPLPTIAALFNLNSAEQVRRILLPAHPLIFLPTPTTSGHYNPQGRTGDDASDLDNVPVHFIHRSVVAFFRDRTRSGVYFVDAQSAHRVLLDACTFLMRRVCQVEDARELERVVGPGWSEAYEYACRYWEAHRRFGLKSKL